MEWAHWKIDGRIIRNYIDKSADGIKWLEDMGLRFDSIPPLYNYFDLRTFHCTTGNLATGPEVSRVLRKKCEELGVQMLFHCPAKKILTENGKVTGVLATLKDKEIKINTKSVIIATGGYGGNKEYLKKFHPTYSEKLFYSGPLTNTGDGLTLATEAGAATTGSGTLLLSQHVPESIHTHSSMNYIAHDFGTLWVNKYGQRFSSERNPDHATALYAQPEKMLYTLFDERFKNIFTEGHYDACGKSKQELPG